MEKNTKLTIGTIITVMLAMSGTYYLVQDDDAYYCEAKNMVMICEKLSSGLGTRCYYEDTYKICKEGWTELEMGQEIKNNVSITEGIKYLCSPKECIKIK